MKDPQLQWPALLPGEVELTDPNDVLFRQVHPTRVRGNKVSSEAFKPNSGDNQQLSCTQAGQISAQDAFVEYTQLGLQSAGCAVLSVEEVESPRPIPSTSQAQGKQSPADPAALRVVDDTGTPGTTPTGHAYVDYRPIGSKPTERKAKQLAYFVNQRQSGFLALP